MKRRSVDFWDCAGEILRRLSAEGVLCTVADGSGRHNVLTLGWGQIGPFYHGNPVFTIAVTPLRHSWRFLEEVPEFTVAVPGDGNRRAVGLCGSVSGRDADKFQAASLTAVPGLRVKTVSILEFPVNVECRVYAKVAPPHLLLTPEHRKSPVGEQHTIYFAEVLGTYAWDAEG